MAHLHIQKTNGGMGNGMEVREPFLDLVKDQLAGKGLLVTDAQSGQVRAYAPGEIAYVSPSDGEPSEKPKEGKE